MLFISLKDSHIWKGKQSDTSGYVALTSLIISRVMLPSIYTRSKMTYTWVQLTFASNHKTPTLFSIKLVILEQQLREIYNGTQIWVHMAFQIWTNAQKTTGHDSRELRTSFTYFYKSLSTGLLGNHVVTKYAYHNLIKSIEIIDYSVVCTN